MRVTSATLAKWLARAMPRYDTVTGTAMHSMPSRPASIRISLSKAKRADGPCSTRASRSSRAG
jgi:hypothetical protein